MRTILGLIIGLMGMLGLLLALIAGNIHRNLALENHQEAMVGLARLKATDLLLSLENHARDMGVALQSEVEFRKAHAAGDMQGLQAEMSRQFHQYFVTAGVLDLKKLTVYDLSGIALIEVLADSAENLRGHPVCPHLLTKAAKRNGPQRAQVLTELCLVEGKPYQMVLVAVGGLRPKGYLAVIVDPLPALIAIESSLGMPIKLGYQNNVVYKTAAWPAPDRMQDYMVATYTLAESSGLPAITISVLNDYGKLHGQLRHTRWLLMAIAMLITLLFISISLLVFRNTTILPLRNLTARLRHVGRDRASLLGNVNAEGAAEIQELTRDFNHMAAELGDLYETLETMAFYDALTGLPNRNRFHERLTALVNAAQPQSETSAVLLMDLDRFKAVNDTLGHHVGDQLLREVGMRLRKVLDGINPGKTQDDGTSYMIARIGGDEFAVILPNIVGAAQAVDVAHLLTNALEYPCVINEHKLHTGSSIGIAYYPQDGNDQNTLMRRADLAMYHAKSAHRGFSVYNATMEEGNLLHLSLENELSRAVENEELFLEYQPQIDVRTRKITGVEALVRWMHPGKGLVAPVDFISLAEKSGLIHSLTEWVLKRALRDCTEWRHQGYAFGVSVNLSPVNLQHPGILGLIVANLRECAVPDRYLTLELTESAVMTDPEHAIQVLTSLCEAGVNISIDDFGTGHCSLSYVKKLPANELKIDRAFILGMNRNQSDMVIVRSTIDLAHNMGMSVVAEGVESEDVLRNLKILGCDRLQGYHITRPLPLAALLNWLASYGLESPVIAEAGN